MHDVEPLSRAPDAERYACLAVDNAEGDERQTDACRACARIIQTKRVLTDHSAFGSGVEYRR